MNTKTPSSKWVSEVEEKESWTSAGRPNFSPGSVTNYLPYNLEHATQVLQTSIFSLTEMRNFNQKHGWSIQLPLPFYNSIIFNSAITLNETKQIIKLFYLGFLVFKWSWLSTNTWYKEKIIRCLWEKKHFNWNCIVLSPNLVQGKYITSVPHVFCPHILCPRGIIRRIFSDCWVPSNKRKQLISVE